MAVGANSYGTAAAVAVLTKRFTVNGSFTTTSTPTLTEVESFIDTVSAWINTALARNGFAIPITQADVKAVLAGMAVEAAGDLVNAANSSGRFYTEKALERGLDPLRILRREISDAIDEQATGFEALGASRNISRLGTICFRDGDDAGNDVEPLFTRGAFGNKDTY